MSICSTLLDSRSACVGRGGPSAPDCRPCALVLSEPDCKRRTSKPSCCGGDWPPRWGCCRLLGIGLTGVWWSDGCLHSRAARLDSQPDDDLQATPAGACLWAGLIVVVRRGCPQQGLPDSARLSCPSSGQSQAQHVKATLQRLLACVEGLAAGGGWGRFCQTSGGGCCAGGTCSCAAGCGAAACAPRGCSLAGRAPAAPGRHLGVAASLHRQAARTRATMPGTSRA